MNSDIKFKDLRQMTIRKVELTFQVSEFLKTETVFIATNCKGLSVIEAAIDYVEEQLGYADGEIILHKDGQTLKVSLEEYELSNMVVCARIIETKDQPDL